MAGFREHFIKNTQLFSRIVPISSLLGRFKETPLIPVYHTVSDKPLPHIRNLYPVKSIDSFKKDLDFLLKYFNPIGYEDFESHVFKKTKLKPNSFLLTFDDGLSEFYNYIAPILLEKGIPAICFLNSDFIDNRELFYRYKVSLLIDALKLNPKKNEDKQVIEWNINNFNSGNTLTNLLNVNYLKRNILDELEPILEEDFNAFLLNHKPYLTSTQIDSLIKQGFYFGAHSCNHPEYQTISIEDQILQTKQSMDFIQQRFKLQYRTFAFPFTDYGVRKSFFDSIFKNKTIDITFACAGLKQTGMRQHFHRLPLELEKLSAEKIIKSAIIYSKMKSLIKK